MPSPYPCQSMSISRVDGEVHKVPGVQAEPLASPASRTLAPRSSLRVAVVGCGAIVRDFHLPVLAGHPAVRLVALVDRDVGRAAELARAYGIGTILRHASEL